ncbi:hypothetical protein, conserved [Eimeria brunetti]|uniref:Prefoldin subunit n=1 Tax=Eimeria brunetti TaxID=51314 RepID=U6LWG2_9EIME|nr:hypothetical protein, conserved [Eimeria brunetti]
MVKPGGAPGPSDVEPLRQQLQQLEKERMALTNTIAELQQDSSDHQLVLDAFKGLEPSRRCYRLVGGVLVERTGLGFGVGGLGGVLVERTVGEVEPALQQHRARGSADVPHLQQRQGGGNCSSSNCSSNNCSTSAAAEGKKKETGGVLT